MTSARVNWLFLRLLGLVYVLAFWSLATQVIGLIGRDGILPAREYMDGARQFLAGEHVGLDRCLAIISRTVSAFVVPMSFSSRVGTLGGGVAGGTP